MEAAQAVEEAAKVTAAVAKAAEEAVVRVGV